MSSFMVDKFWLKVKGLKSLKLASWFVMGGSVVTPKADKHQVQILQVASEYMAYSAPLLHCS